MYDSVEGGKTRKIRYLEVRGRTLPKGELSTIHYAIIPLRKKGEAPEGGESGGLHHLILGHEGTKMEEPWASFPMFYNYNNEDVKVEIWRHKAKDELDYVALPLTIHNKESNRYSELRIRLCREELELEEAAERLMKELEQLEREEVEMVEIELRVGKEKKIVGEPLLCWEDED